MKAHAAATSGECRFWTVIWGFEANDSMQISGVDLQSSMNPRKGKITQKAQTNSGSVVTPCLILGAINAWNLWNEHWEHWEHLPPLEERVEYPYQNIRMKNFFWGDGDKVRE